MTGDEFRDARERLDPELFRDYMPEPSGGRGRPPTGDVTQAVLGAYLGYTAAAVQRWETGKHPIPDLVARNVRELLQRSRQKRPSKKK